MKKISTLILAALFLSLMPFSAANAQEKKNEQKIKIVVSDGSGTKVIIDTLIKDGSVKDTLILKNGKTIIIGNAGDDKMITSHSGNGSVFVTVTSDDNNSGNIEKEVTVISSDSKPVTAGNDKGNVYVVTKSGSEGGDNHQYRVITSSSGNNEKEGSVIYITEDGKDRLITEKSSNVKVVEGHKIELPDRSTYMIAKDGIVVSIEGGDDAKTKELVKEIEKLMGVNKKSDTKKEASKTETTKKVNK
jgi:UDP-N-acetylglucosamine transferase subunit ALG13